MDHMLYRIQIEIPGQTPQELFMAARCITASAERYYCIYTYFFDTTKIWTWMKLHKRLTISESTRSFEFFQVKITTCYPQ